MTGYIVEAKLKKKQALESPFSNVISKSVESDKEKYFTNRR